MQVVNMQNLEVLTTTVTEKKLPDLFAKQNCELSSSKKKKAKLWK